MPRTFKTLCQEPLNQYLEPLKPNAMNKETWKFILQTLAAILTAIATSIGVSSCTLNLLNY